MQSEFACFHLNTTDIGSSVDIANQYGSVNAYRNDILWYNISLKTILGEMFDKYDKFNIKLCSIMYSASTLIPSSNAVDLNLKINIGELPFVNCTYHTKSACNLSTCTIGSFTLGTNATQIYYNDDNVFTIEKPKDTTNIRIFFTKINDIAPTWTNAGPAFDLYFRVYGVKNDD